MHYYYLSRQQQNIANAQNPSLSASNGACIQNLTSLNGWLVEKGSPLPVEQLPTWIEHIPLKSIKIDRVRRFILPEQK